MWSMQLPLSLAPAQAPPQAPQFHCSLSQTGPADTLGPGATASHSRPGPSFLIRQLGQARHPPHGAASVHVRGAVDGARKAAGKNSCVSVRGQRGHLGPLSAWLLFGLWRRVGRAAVVFALWSGEERLFAKAHALRPRLYTTQPSRFIGCWLLWYSHALRALSGPSDWGCFLSVQHITWDKRQHRQNFQVVRKTFSFRDTAFNRDHNGRKILAGMVHCASTNAVFMKKGLLLYF